MRIKLVCITFYGQEKSGIVKTKKRSAEIENKNRQNIKDKKEDRK